MKALSVRAPWWWAILHLGKDIENRDWYTHFRGTIWLHAGKWWNSAEIIDTWNWEVLQIWSRANPGVTRPSGPAPETLQAGCGCLVGKIDVVDCKMNIASPWFCGKWGFVLANPVALPKPIPFKGALGFFEVPDGIEEQGSGVEPTFSVGGFSFGEAPRETPPLDELTLWGQEAKRDVDLGAAGIRRDA